MNVVKNFDIAAIAAAVIATSAMAVEEWPMAPTEGGGWAVFSFGVADSMGYADALGQMGIEPPFVAATEQIDAQDPNAWLTMEKVWVTGHKEPDPWSVSPPSVLGYYGAPTGWDPNYDLNGADPYTIYNNIYQQVVDQSVGRPVKVPILPGQPDQNKADARCNPLASATTQATTSLSSPEQRFAAANQLFSVMMMDRYGQAVFQNIQNSMVYSTSGVCRTALPTIGYSGPPPSYCTSETMIRTFSMTFADGYKGYYMVTEARPPTLINMGEAPAEGSFQLPELPLV